MNVARWLLISRSIGPFLWSALAGAAAYVIWTRLEHISAEHIAAQIRALPTQAIALAAVSCLLSYVLVGIYEGLAVERASGHKLPAYSFLTSWIANPIGHMVGLAAVSGGALRYRMYSAAGISGRQIAAVIMLMMLPYVLGIVTLLIIVLVLEGRIVAELLQVPRALVTAAAVVATLGLAAYILLNTHRAEPLRVAKLHLPLPGLRLTLLQIVFGAAQTMLVASVLYFCMPEELHLYWLQFIGAYLIALLLAQASHVPAGLGVLEASMLLLLPQIQPGRLIGAMLAYRFIFEFVPLMIALLLLFGRESRARGRRVS